MEKSVLLWTKHFIRDPSVAQWRHDSCIFLALNKVGFLRRFQFRIVAVAGRFVLQSDEEMNEFSQTLENENTVYFLWSPPVLL